MTACFRRIGIIGKPGDPRVCSTVGTLAEHLMARGLAVATDQLTRETLASDECSNRSLDKLGNDNDLLIVVGGDGTLLGAARTMAEADVPLLGINLGRLGFHVDVSPETMLDTIDSVLAGEYDEERRFLLDARIGPEPDLASPSLAFNDVVLHKWNTARMVEFETYIDRQFVHTQRSDGLIISTPTGSTAYALSGGGPLLHPDLNALLLVPICPHTLSNRPIVVNGDSRVEVRLCGFDAELARISCDGQKAQALKLDDRVFVSKYPHPVRLLHPKGHDHYKILRAKLGWGGHPSMQDTSLKE